MATNAIFSPFSGYILADAVWSGTTPLDGYAVSDFAFMKPEKRVKWGVRTVTVTATIPGGVSRLADVLVVPMWNADAGAAVVRLTNTNGLSVAVTVPAVPTGPYGRLPPSTGLDFRLLASAGTRTANAWSVVITLNSVNVTMGGAIWLGTATDFTTNFRYELKQTSAYSNGVERNFYGVVNNIRSRSRLRSVTFGVPSKDAQRDTIMDWVDAGEGSGLPSIFWPLPSVNDPLYGSFTDEASNVWLAPGFSPVDNLQFNEWSKGIPLL